ncbi:MAG: sigma-54 dependent transcriptional regulator [Terriglobales bacterium]
MGSNQRDIDLKLLVAGTEPEYLDGIVRALASERVDLIIEKTAELAFRRLLQVRPRVVVSDVELPEMSGLELLDKVIAVDPGVDFILMASSYSAEAAVDSIRRGAADYLVKGVELDRLQWRIRSLSDDARTRQKTLQLDQSLSDAYKFEGMIGRSPLMLELFGKIRRLAPHFRTVLVTGATGTGKELVAKALHRLSPVSMGPFAICNCSALMETLLESELFGYVRGAFTGAAQDKQGIFEYANGGTVFLDEVGELPLTAQAKLLRVLQNQEVQRVGSPVPHKVNVRVVAATHRDLRKMVSAGQFRQDLFYRLSVVEVTVPRLLQRMEDLPFLQRHFVEKFAALYNKTIIGITRRAQAKLNSHTWPGNVRELENVISGGCMMTMGTVIDLHDLRGAFHTPAMPVMAEDELLSTLEQIQRRHLIRVLRHVGGNKARAAEILGVGRNTIYQMLSRLENESGEAAPNQ